MHSRTTVPAPCPVENCGFGEKDGLNYGALTAHVCDTDDPAHNLVQDARDWYCYET